MTFGEDKKRDQFACLLVVMRCRILVPKSATTYHSNHEKLICVLSQCLSGKPRKTQVAAQRWVGIDGSSWARDRDLFQDGNTCAHVAAMHGSVDVIKELLMFNSAMVLSSRNETDDVTPLHLAAETGNAEVVKVLLEAGASASDEDKVCAA